MIAEDRVCLSLYEQHVCLIGFCYLFSDRPYGNREVRNLPFFVSRCQVQVVGFVWASVVGRARRMSQSTSRRNQTPSCMKLSNYVIKGFVCDRILPTSSSSALITSNTAVLVVEPPSCMSRHTDNPTSGNLDV